MKCESCSADIPPESERCEFCGSHVPRAPLVPASAPVPSRSEIFQRIKSSAEYQAAAIGQGLDTPAVPTALFFQTGFLAFFCCAAGFMTFIFALVAGPMCVFPLFMLAIGIFGLMKSGTTTYSYASAEATPVPAIITSKRVEMRGKRGTLAHYFATFEYESGERDEFPIWEQSLFGKLAEEDAGVLIRRGPVAVGFRRVAM
ncbi:DUF2500 domain-containing protein [Blastopirellula sp. JC732]|uniref:DUF2500 domain-containing protein n=1 Tax=Blastopirellula sediminis TaxID=2894196 RepID=A0A9X1MRC0_9BACT|nr:DUF2500 domain-containing protein [Blastopirellula sediminis]MCC9605750.1 DUF2500 domain-containing protein [Blastopirellula sediminis]MCC9630950.1 DUF2500 domain-containing protein [Blastopirellula sediminis]